MEEAVRELTAWVSSGPDWSYTLVQLSEDTCYAPLPKEGHLGILPQGGASMTAVEGSANWKSASSSSQACRLPTW